MFIILDRYIGKLILNTIIKVILILILISSIIKFMDQLKKIGQGNYDLISAINYTLLCIPKDIQFFFPMASLIGGLVGLGIITQNNEILIMQASGFTKMQITNSVLKTSIPLILLVTVFSEIIIPQSEKIARNYRSQAMHGKSIFATKYGLWIKDNSNFIHIEYVKSNYELYGISIFNLDKHKNLKSISNIKSAKFIKHKEIWFLDHVYNINLKNKNKIENTYINSSIWKTKITPDTIYVVILDPNSLSILSLYNYIKYIKSSGKDTNYYQLNMWNKVFQPVYINIMILMSVLFTLGPLRKTSMGIRVFTGISVGFLFYIINQICGSLTLIKGIQPIFSALLPSIIFFMISLWILIKFS